MMIKVGDQRKLGASELVVPVLGAVSGVGAIRASGGCGQLYMRNDVFQAYRTCLDTGTEFYKPIIWLSSASLQKRRMNDHYRLFYGDDSAVTLLHCVPS